MFDRQPQKYMKKEESSTGLDFQWTGKRKPCLFGLEERRSKVVNLVFHMDFLVDGKMYLQFTAGRVVYRDSLESWLK